MEIKLQPENSVYTTAEYHKDRPRATHLEQRGGHRSRLLMAGAYSAELTADYGCTTLVDIGCGDGGFLQLINLFYDKVWGYDFQPANIDGARIDRKVDVKYYNIVKEFEKLDLNADVGVMTEVLEHLDNPHTYLKELLLKTSLQYLILSSPVNETLEKHYEGHVWAWDMGGYANLINESGWLMIKNTSAQGFQVALATRKRAEQ